MINNPIIFYIASVLIVSFGLITLFIKNITYSLLSAVMVFFSASIFFYMLGSEYNAIIQAAIYGFAVPIIIGISVMFTSTKTQEKKDSLLNLVVLISCILFGMSFIYGIMISLSMLPESFHFMEIQQFNSYDILSEFARGIYINYVFAFELLSILLTVVVAGLTLYKKSKEKI